MNICAKLRAGIATATAEETRTLAAGLAAELPGQVVLALHGDLGVGKTTFVQGLARGLGVPGAVTSPTFGIYSVHPGTRRKLIHLDAYRLENHRQMDALLLEEFLHGDYCLAVEWPEKIGEWLPTDAWHLTLSIEANEHHRVILR